MRGAETEQNKIVNRNCNIKINKKIDNFQNQYYYNKKVTLALKHAKSKLQ